MWLFYLWLCGSIAVLVRRRVSTGTLRPGSARSTAAPLTEAVAPATITVKETPPNPSGPGAESLAEALSGVTMPCGLTPFTTGDFDPRKVSFATTGHSPTDVATALADEFERLGFEWMPIDDRTVRAQRAGDDINIKLLSALLDSPAVMQQRFPATGADALVVELRLH